MKSSEDNTKKRIRTETRYNPIQSRLDEKIKQLKLEQQYKMKAPYFDVQKEKNYSKIFLTLCLIQEAYTIKGESDGNVIIKILDQIAENLDEILLSKYSKFKQLIMPTKNQNLKDINAIKEIFSVNGYDQNRILQILKIIYSTNKWDPIKKILKILKSYRGSQERPEEKGMIVIDQPSSIEQNISYMYEPGIEQLMFKNPIFEFGIQEDANEYQSHLIEQKKSESQIEQQLVGFENPRFWQIIQEEMFIQAVPEFDQ